MFSAHNFSISAHFGPRFENLLQDKFFLPCEGFLERGTKSEGGKGRDNPRVATNEFFLIQKEYTWKCYKKKHVIKKKRVIRFLKIK